MGLCTRCYPLYPRKRTLFGTAAIVRFVPEADIEATPTIVPKGILFRVVR
jgi:hypothetical protein